jgi:heme exporter protein CcmD
MNELLDMGKYGVYVWSSYALFGAMLAWDVLMPRLRARRVLRELRRRHEREAARRQTAGTDG